MTVRDSAVTTRGSATTWDGFTADDLARRCGVPRVELHATTTSTLDVAHTRAESDAPAGTVVLADAQTAGRGRLGRAWSSEPGRGVWVTVVERPRDRLALDVLSLRVGLEMAESLDALAGERVGVKWPNDLVVAAGKIAGVLVEARWSAGGNVPGWIAVGVGVNVAPPPQVPDAAGLAGVERVQVLEAVVHGIRRGCAAAGHLTAQEIARYNRRDILKGRTVSSPANGVVAGIDASGAIIIHTTAGAEAHRAGTIRFAEDS